jgi:hypothetical protein
MDAIRLATPDGVRTDGWMVYGLPCQRIATRLARGSGRTFWVKVGLDGVMTLAIRPS